MTGVRSQASGVRQATWRNCISRRLDAHATKETDRTRSVRSPSTVFCLTDSLSSTIASFGDAAARPCGRCAAGRVRPRAARGTPSGTCRSGSWSRRGSRSSGTRTDGRSDFGSAAPSSTSYMYTRHLGPALVELVRAARLVEAASCRGGFPGRSRRRAACPTALACMSFQVGFLILNLFTLAVGTTVELLLVLLGELGELAGHLRGEVALGAGELEALPGPLADEQRDDDLFLVLLRPVLGDERVLRPAPACRWCVRNAMVASGLHPIVMTTASVPHTARRAQRYRLGHP